jgi:dihydrodipicolinate synthase/N-acetylneuraminate lyase
VPPPYYDRLDDDALVERYRRLGEAADVGLMVYDQGWRGAFGPAIGLPLMERLA